MIMPYVDLTKIEKIYARAMMKKLIDHNGMLVCCPNIHLPNCFKLIHNELLKLLVKDNRWVVPVPDAWNMPHIEAPERNKNINFAKMIALFIINSNCFYGNEIKRKLR